MTYVSRVKETTTATTTATISLAGAQAGFRSFALKHIVGEAGITVVVDDGAGNWLEGTYTLTSSTLLTRTAILGSSASDGEVTFNTGSKAVFESISGASLNKLQSVDDVAFSAAIPLTAQGIRYMPQQTVGSVIAFTAAAAPIKNAQIYARLIADAVNLPTFTGMKEWGGSLGYDNRNGISNQITFWYDGYDIWYAISQAVGAVAVPVAPSAPGIVTATGGNASASVTFTAPASNGGAAITTYTATSSPGGFVGTVASVTPITVSGLTNGTAYTFTVTATNSVGTGPASAASISVIPAASTVAGAPTIGTATGGDTSASVTFTAPASTGGSAITSYTVTSAPGAFTASGATSPLTVTGLTNGTAYTFTVKANNANGASAASAISNSVVPAAAAVARMGALLNATESTTQPYIYTGSGAAYFGGATGDAVCTTAFQSGIDGSFVLQFLTTPGNSGPEIMLALYTTAAASTSYASNLYGMVNHGAGYVPYNGATAGATSGVGAANNDYMKIARIGTSVVLSTSNNSGATYSTIATYTGAPTTALYVHTIFAGAGTYKIISTSGMA